MCQYWVDTGKLLDISNSRDILNPSDSEFERSKIFTEHSRLPDSSFNSTSTVNGISKQTDITTIIADSVSVQKVQLHTCRSFESISTVSDIDKNQTKKKTKEINANYYEKKKINPLDIKPKDIDMALKKMISRQFLQEQNKYFPFITVDNTAEIDRKNSNKTGHNFSDKSSDTQCLGDTELEPEEKLKLLKKFEHPAFMETPPSNLKYSKLRERKRREVNRKRKRDATSDSLKSNEIILKDKRKKTIPRVVLERLNYDRINNRNQRASNKD